MPENITCPTGCDNSALPAVVFDKCSPEFRISEFTHVAVAEANATAFTNWLQPTEWATRLSQSDTVSPDAIRLLTIRGNKPAPTETTQVLTGNRTIVTQRRHVLNFVIDEVNDTNYDFFRTLECGNIQMLIWPITNDGKEIQGGNSGIRASIKGAMIYDEGNGAIQRFQGTMEWDSRISPPRGVNPIAGF